MMRRLYSFFYWLALWPRGLLGRLHLGVSGEQGEVFGQRLGRFRAKTKQALTNRQRLWIHATSREAVHLATHVLVRLERRAPFLKMVVTTSTTEGMSRLRRLMPMQVERLFVPFDLWRAVQRSVNLIHPEAVVLLDAEMRPNLMRRLRHRGIPVVLLAGAVGKALPRRYRVLRPLYRPAFESLAGVAVPDEAAAERLRGLGCRAEVMEVVGEWPVSPTVLGERRPLDVPDMVARLGVPEGARLLVAGRTHAGEELALAEAFLRLRSRFPELFLVLVPDNYRRGKEVGRELKTLNLRYVYRTAVSTVTRHAPGTVDCLVVNTRDEAPQFEAQASVVFVGGSLSSPGRANLVEAGSLGKPLVFGPELEHCPALAEALLAGGAARRVGGAGELEPALADILADERRREEMGVAARRIVERSRDAVDHAVDMILRQLDPGIAAGSLR